MDNFENDQPVDADYRRWGGPYWFQNTRLIYWPMLAAGDFDLMRPLFQMYRDVLPVAQARVRCCYGHGGAFFPETMTFGGLYANSDYGWNRDGQPPGYVENPYMRYYYSAALELVAMMLDYFEYTEEIDFAQSTLVPIAQGILQFYDLHYQRDDVGKLRIEPAQALETFHNVVNPAPDIAGLRSVVDRLVASARTFEVEGAVLATWQRLQAEIPDLPTGQSSDGRMVLLAAERILEDGQNTENPELYAVFPYRIFGVGKPELEVGRATFARRRHQGHVGWCQDCIQAAYLGLTKEARQGLFERFSVAVNSACRFPAFWGPNFDWTPDQDHGSVGMIAYQAMIMQCEGRRIILFPAWPKEWNVEFRLHAPFGTIVEGLYAEGQPVQVNVTPQARRQDVTVMAPQ